MNKIVSMFFLLLTTTAFAPPQRTIKGVVKDEYGSAIPGVSIIEKGTNNATVTDATGYYSLSNVSAADAKLVFSFVGYVTQEVKVGNKAVVDVVLVPDVRSLQEVVVVGYGQGHRSKRDATTGPRTREQKVNKSTAPSMAMDYQYESPDVYQYSHNEENNEEYAGVQENTFKDAMKDPLSTFSIDVDAASYSNVRRFINNGQRPPKDAVRIEEMINYFTYDYSQPKGDDPFNVITEISSAPWNEKHKLVHIALQGKKIATENLPPSNLVFLIDVSGSMNAPNRLPLVKSSLRMLVEKLRAQDHVAMVVYAGAAGLVLEPTSGSEKAKIYEALDRLGAGGSTAGGAGIRLAYEVAKKHYKASGNNRVILATDGDFNVGESSNQAMENLIEEKRKDGVFLTVLGYGMGNYKDAKLELLADKGNGNYAYIDNLTEAHKVLVSEFGGTLFTIAKDVKLQLEFNPAKVKAYRLIGYENRLLKSEDFHNDRKDAGELGSGHTVTALYEVIPVGVESDAYKVDALKYQTFKIDEAAKKSDEILTVKLRYKKPTEDVSKLIVHPLVDKNTALSATSNNFRWAASVAAFGMLLRDSEHVHRYSYESVVKLAQQAKGQDEEGYRSEFINLVKAYGALASSK